MFPTEPIRRYINLAFAKKIDETAKAYAQEVSKIRQKLSPNSGMYFKAIMLAGVQVQQSKVEAYIEIVREACRQANRPVDNEVRAFMLGEIHNMCTAGKNHVIQAMAREITRGGMKFPDGLLPALTAQASTCVLAIESGIGREFKIEELSEGINQSVGTNNPVETKPPIPSPAVAKMGDGTPWYQTNLFWGSASLGIAVVLAVIAATKRDLTWLLWFAGPFLVVASWAAISKLKHAWLKGLLLIVSISGVGICLYGIRVWLRPGTPADSPSTAAPSTKSVVSSPETTRAANGEPQGTVEGPPPSVDVIGSKRNPGAEVKPPPKLSPPSMNQRAIMGLPDNGITFNHNPQYGWWVNVLCRNMSSSLTAKSVVCTTSTEIIPTTNRAPTKETLREVWLRFSKLVTHPAPSVDLEPGKGIWGSFGLDMHDIDPALTSGDKVVVVAGAISYTDDTGRHRKEYCRWSQPPFDPTNTVWHLCEIGHNGEVH